MTKRLVEVEKVFGKAEGATWVLVSLKEGITNTHQPRLNLWFQNVQKVLQLSICIYSGCTKSDTLWSGVV